MRNGRRDRAGGRVRGCMMGARFKERAKLRRCRREVGKVECTEGGTLGVPYLYAPTEERKSTRCRESGGAGTKAVGRVGPIRQCR